MLSKKIGKANVFLLLLFVFFCINIHVSKNTTMVSGVSMQPTFQDGDILSINTIFSFDEIRANDIVIIQREVKGHKECYVKRVIGKPGDIINIQNDQIWVNDVYYGEMRGIDPNVTDEREYPVYLAENEYFVMGDNRKHSWDSRSSSFGNVLDSEIYAVVTRDTVKNPGAVEEQ